MKKIIKIEPSAVGKILMRKRVAAYCRVSTGSDEQLESLETQKSHYEEYISSNPEWEYAGLYYDEGITGRRKDLRPALMQMMQDCEAGKIDVILTKSLSRFARNTMDCLELVRRLQELGITVYFEKENLNTEKMESELLLSVMSGLAQSESESMSQNNKWSVRRRFEDGTFKSCCAPFGYSIKDGVYSINEDEAKWVRFMFDNIVKGLSSHQVAQLLTENKVPTRKGGKWRSSTVCSILKNERYIGDCLFQKTCKDSHCKRRRNNGEADQFYAKEHHEAIISRDVFDAVQNSLEHRAKEKHLNIGKANTHYPFTGKIVCGECGAMLVRHINTIGTVKSPVWVCREHLHHKEKCSMKYVKESALKSAFSTMMNKLIFASAELLQGLLNDIRRQNNNANRVRMAEIDVAISEMTERRQSLSLLASKGYLDLATFAQENNSLINETEKLRKEKEQIINGANDQKHRTAALEELIRFTGKKEMLSEFDGETFENFVDHVTVVSRASVTFHLKCGLNLSEVIQK